MGEVLAVFGRAVAGLDVVLEELELWADREAAAVVGEEVVRVRGLISEGLTAVAVAAAGRGA